MTKQKCSLTAKNVSAVSILFHHWLHARADMFFYSPSIHISVKTVELHKNNAVTVRIYCFSMWCIHFYFRSDHRLTFPSSVQFHLVFLNYIVHFLCIFHQKLILLYKIWILINHFDEKWFFRHRQAHTVLLECQFKWDIFRVNW